MKLQHLRTASFGTLLFLGMQLAAPLSVPSVTHAQSHTASSKTLLAQLTKTYPWQRPNLIPRSLDGKEFSLSLYEGKNAPSLADGIGARILNMYMTQLPHQSIYLLTAYSLPQNGAPVWQYMYTPGNKLLSRRQFSTTPSLTQWSITPSAIAQAAKSGHWPKPNK